MNCLSWHVQNWLSSLFVFWFDYDQQLFWVFLLRWEVVVIETKKDNDEIILLTIFQGKIKTAAFLSLFRSSGNDLKTSVHFFAWANLFSWLSILLLLMPFRSLVVVEIVLNGKGAFCREESQGEICSTKTRGSLTNIRDDKMGTWICLKNSSLRNWNREDASQNFLHFFIAVWYSITEISGQIFSHRPGKLRFCSQSKKNLFREYSASWSRVHPSHGSIFLPSICWRANRQKSSGKFARNSDKHWSDAAKATSGWEVFSQDSRLPSFLLILLRASCERKVG